MQLYIKDMESEVSYRPVKSLRGIKSVWLDPGESKTIEFTVEPGGFSLYDPERNEYVVEPGIFKVMLGGSSLDMDLVTAEFEVL